MLLAVAGGQVAWPFLAAVLVITAAGIPVLSRASRCWGDALVLEACRGYTTTPATTARWWGLPAPLVGQGARGVGIPWDLTGVWHLAEDGTVLAEPDLEADPPGVFPGPDGRWMVWTGVVWVDYRPVGWEWPG